MDGIELLQQYLTGAPTSQAQLARDVQCSESHLSLILARKRGLSLPLAQRISGVTGVPMRALLPDVAEAMREAEPQQVASQ